MNDKLKDLVQHTRQITIKSANGRDLTFTLYPISLSDICRMIDAYPEFGPAINSNVTMAQFAVKCAVAVPDMICTSLRQPEATEAASQLSLHQQIEFLDKIAEISMPHGVHPLMLMLAGIVAGRDGQTSATQS